MAARLRLVLMFIFVARWSNDLFIFLLLLDFFVLVLVIINESVELAPKKKHHTRRHAHTLCVIPRACPHSLAVFHNSSFALIFLQVSLASSRISQTSLSSFFFEMEMS
jgi:hypothetical protein